MTTARYIATDEQTTAIYGIGDSPEAAIEDARDQAGDAEHANKYVTYPVSDALYSRVERDGGGPDVRWTLEDGVAVLDDPEVWETIIKPAAAGFGEYEIGPEWSRIDECETLDDWQALASETADLVERTDEIDGRIRGWNGPVYRCAYHLTGDTTYRAVEIRR